MPFLYKNTSSGLTVYVVDLEEEPDLVVGRFSGELVHRVNEFLQRYRPGTVLVEDLEDSFREEWLKTNEMIYVEILSISKYTQRIEF